MKNIKKFVAIVLCMLLISSVMVVSAEENKFSGIVSKKIEVLGNGDVEVLIDIAGNPGIMALILEVSYDKEVLTLKENGFTDTGLLVGNVDTTITKNPFRLGWQHSDGTAVNNYKNGTIAKLTFEMKEGFTGTTDVVVNVLEAQTFKNNIFGLIDLESAIITITKPKLAIKDDVAVANSVNGATFIVASYDEHRMIDYKVYQNLNGNMQVRVADVINTSGATKFKAFLWENLETCMPVCESVEA